MLDLSLGKAEKIRNWEDVMESENKNFKYALAQKKSLCIISFTGVVDQEAIEDLEKCHQELNEANCPLVILNFSDVTEIDQKAHRHLVQIQKAVRNDLEGHVRVFGIKSSWKSDLVEQGILRNEELHDDLRAALIELNGLNEAA